jgi:hypothetical protein
MPDLQPFEASFAIDCCQGARYQRVTGRGDLRVARLEVPELPLSATLRHESKTLVPLRRDSSQFCR